MPPPELVEVAIRRLLKDGRILARAGDDTVAMVYEMDTTTDIDWTNGRMVREKKWIVQWHPNATRRLPLHETFSIPLWKKLGWDLKWMMNAVEFVPSRTLEELAKDVAELFRTNMIHMLNDPSSHEHVSDTIVKGVDYAVVKYRRDPTSFASRYNFFYTRRVDDRCVRIVARHVDPQRPLPDEDLCSHLAPAALYAPLCEDRFEDNQLVFHPARMRFQLRNRFSRPVLDAARQPVVLPRDNIPFEWDDASAWTLDPATGQIPQIPALPAG